LAGLYLADEAIATMWHHNILMGSRAQTIYGAASKVGENEYYLDWETKGPAILGLIGGLDR
jgi:hypothetical protein